MIYVFYHYKKIAKGFSSSASTSQQGKELIGAEATLELSPQTHLKLTHNQQKLLADRSSQLGEEFDLGKFHDEFLAYGPIPISLIRWEMMGLDDEVKIFWQE